MPSRPRFLPSRIVLAAILSLLILPGAVRADKIILKNGEIIKGKILGEEGEKYVIKVGSGKMKIPKAQVAEVRYEKASAEPAPPPEEPEPPPEVTPPAEGGTKPSTSAIPPTPPTATPPKGPAAPPPPSAKAADQTPPQWRIPTEEEIIVPAEKLTESEAATLKKLLEQSRSRDFSTQDTAVSTLAKMGSKALNALTTILARSTDTDEVISALAVLSHMSDPRAIPGIRKRVFDPSDAVVEAAGMTLPSYGDLGVPILVDMLQDSSAKIRNEALGNLALCPKTPDVLGGYLLACVDPEPSIRTYAANLMMGWDAASMRKGEAKIMALLKHPEAALRFWAVRLAGIAGLAQAAPAVLEIATKDPEPVTRREALITLGGLPTQSNPDLEDKTLALLKERVESKDEEDRFSALQALVKRRDDWIIEYLIEFLDDESERVRGAAYAGLREVTGQGFQAEKDVWAGWWETRKKQGTGEGG